MRKPPSTGQATRAAFRAAARTHVAGTGTALRSSPAPVDAGQAWRPCRGIACSGLSTPSRNIVCELSDDSRSVGAYCQSYEPPHSARLTAGGRVTICRGMRCIGDPGDAVPPTMLGYGKQPPVGRFRCRSEQVGVTCTVSRTGKGFPEPQRSHTSRMRRTLRLGVGVAAVAAVTATGAFGGPGRPLLHRSPRSPPATATRARSRARAGSSAGGRTCSASSATAPEGTARSP